MSVIRRVLFAILVGLLILVPGDVAGKLLYRHFALTNITLKKEERIVGLEIKVSSGAIRSISALPVGWHVQIDNDPSWQTSIQANTVVGAASLDIDSLRRMRLGITQNEFGGNKFGLSGTLVVTGDFTNERRIALTGESFVAR